MKDTEMTQEERDRGLLRGLKKRVNKARRFMENTDPCVRHVQMMGEYLPMKRGYPMLAEEPVHCAISLLSVVASLYEARNELRELRGEIEWRDQEIAGLREELSK